jgi:hypothetical protein
VTNRPPGAPRTQRHQLAAGSAAPACWPGLSGRDLAQATRANQSTTSRAERGHAVLSLPEVTGHDQGLLLVCPACLALITVRHCHDGFAGTRTWRPQRRFHHVSASHAVVNGRRAGSAWLTWKGRAACPRSTKVTPGRALMWQRHSAWRRDNVRPMSARASGASGQR